MKTIAGIAILLMANLAFGITPEERAQLLEKANKGNSDAMYSLFLDVGERGGSSNKPTPEEYADAKQWLLKAGSLNNWRAAYVLGLCYTKGCWGLQPNAEKAAHFKEVVAKFGPKNE